MGNVYKIFLFLIIIAIFLYTRLSFLNSGIYFVEPDEWSWDFAAKSFHYSWVPLIAGRYLFDQIPLFEIIAFGVSFIIKDSVFPRTFLDIRLVSVFFSALLMVSVFQYLKNKVGNREALYSVFLLLLTPLSLFYSRYGGREMLLLTTLFWFYVSYENLRKNSLSLRRAIFTGLLFGVAIYAKLTALIFLIIPVGFLFLSFMKEVRLETNGFNQFLVKIKFAKDWLVKVRSNFVLAFVPLLMLGLAFIPFSIINHTFLRDRLYLVIFAHSSDSLFGRLKAVTVYLTKPSYWLTFVVLVLVFVGIYRIFRQKDNKWFDLFLFLGITLLFLLTNEVRARYFVVAIPFLIILASLGLGFITRLFKTRVLQFLVPLAVFLSILPFSWNTLQSTNHSGFEQAVRYLKEHQDGRMVFSSYWPPIIQYISGLPTVRLTDRMEDASRDYSEYPKYSPFVNQTPTTIINSREGAWVLVHEPIDKDEFSERKIAIEFVKNNFDPVRVFSDNKPNFPDTNTPYKILIYDTKVKKDQK